MLSSAASLTGIFNIQFFNDKECYKNDPYAWDSKHKKKKDKKNKKKHCEPRQPSLSHLSLFGRIVPTIEVPEPATMAMLALARWFVDVPSLLVVGFLLVSWRSLIFMPSRAG